MNERARLLVPLGGGVDRLAGAAVVGETSEAVLKNTHLYRGRTELRAGLARQLLSAWGTDMLGVFSLAAQGATALVVFDSVSKDVRLYVADSTFAPPSFVGTLWTMPAGIVGLPAVIGADVYGQLILCHDEADMSLRQATKVLDVASFSLSTLQSDLDRSGVAQDCFFRGVVKHLAYAVYWGYGTHSVPDSAHTLRISEPGKPTTLVPEHFEQVGFPGDPILGCGAVGELQLRIGKASSAYKLVGSDRRTFGVITIDENFGLLSGRLQVTVNAENFHWTLRGPRSSTGGPSQDLAMPLDLTGPDPHTPSAGESEPGRQFAFYDSAQGEVVFVFDQWAYVLHLRDSARRWSYRPYGVRLASAGSIFTGGTTVPVAHFPSWAHKASLGGGATDWHDIAYSKALDVVVAVGLTAKYSTDGGATWNACTISIPVGFWWAICWSPWFARFVAVDSGGKIATSADGITFTDRANPGGVWQDVAACDAVPALVVVGLSGALAVSTDAGVTWTSHGFPDPTVNMTGVTGSVGTRMVAVGYNAAGTEQRALYSDDGITWNNSAIATDAHKLDQVTYSNVFTKFFASGDKTFAGTGGVILSSPDGNIWTYLLDTLSEHFGRVILPDDDATRKLLVAVEPSATTHGSATTLNGTTFIYQPITGAHAWVGGCYMPPARDQFLIVASDGEVQRG